MISVNIDWSLAISIIALILSFTSFYYIYLQGPKFRIEHIDYWKNCNDTKCSCMHSIIVVNDGNKTGIIKDIYVKTKTDKTDILPTSIYDKDKNYIDTAFPMSIKPKESINLVLSYNISKIEGLTIPQRKIIIKCETSKFLRIKTTVKTIWESKLLEF